MFLAGSLALAAAIGACSEPNGPVADCYYSSAQSNDAASSTHACLQSSNVGP
ncbi:MAG TPA: hypothetical protein VLV45_13320 [Gemmatimonadales bacterium]|nr:hypothetical protein [Gemmatimonadales bacterium]